MREVLAAIAARRADIDRHPLYRWMADDGVPLDQRFVFAPLFANFILGFRDLNRWFMRYPDPATDHERAINTHTAEDEGHAVLFLEDWAELGLDAHVGWGVEDTMAWYYAAPETEVFRRYALRITQMCVENPDPLVRFGFMEAIEACGHVFFGHTAPLAAALAERTGAALRYFGPYHLARETGALIDADELFDTAVLTDAQRRRSLRLVHEVFDMFTVKNDHLLAYARERAGGVAVPAPAAALRATPVAAAARDRPPVPGPTGPGHRPMVRRLQERRAELAAHPFVAWLADDPGCPAERLLAILPLWIPDIMGYADLMTYALPFPDPATAAERALNRRIRLLASHHRLFAHDAAALRLDERMGWTAGETLRFLGHAQATDLQRESMAVFLDAAYRRPGPVTRYWFVEALQASGDAFFDHTRRLATVLEARDGIRLDYLTDRHPRSHPRLDADPEADAVEFTRLPVSSAEQATAVGLIDRVFDQVHQQFDQSIRLVTAGTGWGPAAWTS